MSTSKESSVKNAAQSGRSSSEGGAPPTPARHSAALAPGLHIAATPIGHSRDITLRVLEALAAADLVLCEDTRETRKLLMLHGVDARLDSYHEHNAARMRPRVLAKLEAGEAIVLVSDAGTPLVSDPGYKLVREAIEAGHAVTALPGPSSVLAALTVSGLPTDRFFFQGFLPAKQKARAEVLAELAAVPATLVLLESAQRLAATLADMAAALGAREAAVARELTKKFEEVRRGSLNELAAHYAEAGPPKGEIVIVAGPPEVTDASAEDLDTALREAMAEESTSRAAATVANRLGIPRKRAYARALELAKERG